MEGECLTALWSNEYKPVKYTYTVYFRRFTLTNQVSMTPINTYREYQKRQHGPHSSHKFDCGISLPQDGGPGNAVKKQKKIAIFI